VLRNTLTFPDAISYNITASEITAKSQATAAMPAGLLLKVSSGFSLGH
jgi:hypothetical protein